MEFFDPFTIGLAIISSATLGLACYAWFDTRGKSVGLGTRKDRWQRLGMDPRLYDGISYAWQLTTAAITLFFFLQGFPLLAAAAASVGCLTRKPFLDFQLRRRERLLRDQIAGACSGIAASVQAGCSLPESLAKVRREIQMPLKKEFARMVFEIEAGRTPREVMLETRERLDLEPFSLLTLIVDTTHRQGGRMSEALRRLQHSLRESQRLERKFAADTAQGRNLAIVLTLFPIGTLVLFSLAAPELTNTLFYTLSGQLSLLAVIVLTYAGNRGMAKILKIEC
jgi:tight adherence protein B